MDGDGVGSVLSSSVKKVIPFTKRRAVAAVKKIGTDIVEKIKRKVKGSLLKRLGKRSPKTILGGSQGVVKKKKNKKKPSQKKKPKNKKSCVKRLKKKSSKVKTKTDLFI